MSEIQSMGHGPLSYGLLDPYHMAWPAVLSVDLCATCDMSQPGTTCCMQHTWALALCSAICVQYTKPSWHTLHMAWGTGSSACVACGALAGLVHTAHGKQGWSRVCAAHGMWDWSRAYIACRNAPALWYIGWDQSVGTSQTVEQPYVSHLMSLISLQ